MNRLRFNGLGSDGGGLVRNRTCGNLWPQLGLHNLIDAIGDGTAHVAEPVVESSGFEHLIVQPSRLPNDVGHFLVQLDGGLLAGQLVQVPVG